MFCRIFSSMIFHCSAGVMAEQRVGMPATASDEEQPRDSRYTSQPAPAIAELLRQGRSWNEERDDNGRQSDTFTVPRQAVDEVPRSSRGARSSTTTTSTRRDATPASYARYPSTSLSRNTDFSSQSHFERMHAQVAIQPTPTWRGDPYHHPPAASRTWPSGSWQRNRSRSYRTARGDIDGRPSTSTSVYANPSYHYQTARGARGTYYARQTYAPVPSRESSSYKYSADRLSSFQESAEASYQKYNGSQRPGYHRPAGRSTGVYYGSSSSHPILARATSPPGRLPTASGPSEGIAAGTSSSSYRPKVTPPDDAPMAAAKRATVSHDGLPPKRLKTGDSPPDETTASKLDLLCTATLELGPLQENPTGCSCPRSNCIKLYCDCFKAGRRCAEFCSCTNCKNTEATQVERTRAIKNILARNPRAFTGGKRDAVPRTPGDIVCNCVKSRCLKLYCDCFHNGRTCNAACACIQCLNVDAESGEGGSRKLAMQQALEKRPDAFTIKAKAIGSGCACKNNRCLKRYCDCFRFNIPCTGKCSCRECGNRDKGSARIVPV